MTDMEDVPEEQRAADQDTAIEQAFVAGTLPEEDRRTPEEKDATAALQAAHDALPATGGTIFVPAPATVVRHEDGEAYVHVSAIHRIAALLGTDAKRVLHFLEAEFAAAEVALHIHPSYGSAIE